MTSTALKQTAFRLTETDLDIIDRTTLKLGLTSRTEALRYILRRHADETGIDVPRRPKKPTPSKKSTKRKKKK